VSGHRSLVSHQLAVEIAVELHRRVASWPTFERWSIGLQLVRAAGSIGANIAEGDGRGHPKDQARFLLIARGSLNETHHWLELAEKANLLTEADYAPRLEELARTLNGLIRRRRGLIPNT
jgi:four helix bundle protein